MRIAESVRTTSALGNDTYIYHIVCGDGWLASISSDDSLRLTDQQTLRIVPLPEHTFSHIHDGVTCLKVRHDRGILTAGRDAVVKCTDLRTKKTALTLSKGMPCRLQKLVSCK